MDWLKKTRPSSDVQGVPGPRGQQVTPLPPPIGHWQEAGPVPPSRLLWWGPIAYPSLSSFSICSQPMAFFRVGLFLPHLQTVRKKEGSWPCAHLQSVAWPPGSNPCRWTPPHAATVSLYPCPPPAGPGWHPAGCWEDAESRHRGTRCCCRACGQLLSRPRPRDCLVESWQHRDACSKGLGPPLLAFDGGGPCGWAQLALSPPEGACCAATHPDPGYGRLKSG